MENTEEFTVHLPSNTRFMEANSASKYVVKLALPATLSGSWECALKEIHYPHSWDNITDGESEIKMELRQPSTNNTVKKTLTLDPGYYADNAQLSKAIEDVLRGGMSGFAERWRKKLHVTCSSHSGKIKLEIPHHVIIGLPKTLASILGFDTESQNFTRLIRGCQQPKFPATINVVDALYVYSDVVRPSLVGDAMVPLLRIVPVAGARGGMSHVEYMKPVYYPVGKQNFSTIEICITDSAGRRIQFKHGKTTVMLHFRRKKHPRPSV